MLTAWREGAQYRDFELDFDGTGEITNIRGLNSKTAACQDLRLSLPIISKDGREMSARDERTGTTKVFRMLSGGRCDEVVDLGIRTSKVAWHRTGRKLVFALPRVRTRGGGVAGGAEGIFLFDRDEGRMTRIPDSERASLFAFPDFIGDESIVFLIPGASRREGSIFRVVDQIR